MIIRERPGIYAEYQVRGDGTVATDSRITVGVAAEAGGGNREAASVSSYMAALQSFGICPMTKLIKTIFLNGCGRIIAAPVTGGDYASAFAALAKKGADIIICDSRDSAAILALKSVLEGRQYSMGIVECTGSADQRISLAQSMNFERMVVCGNGDSVSGNISAALAGVISSEAELFLNGHPLQGVGQLMLSATEQEIDALIAGGVTPIEQSLEEICIVRGVTTRTSTEGIPDKSLREIATVMTAVDVIKSLHNALKLKFARAKNDALTRGAIRSLVAVELEKKLAAGKISSYGGISAVADPEDASLCRVGFEFSAVCGLNTIMLTAYLNV